MDEKTILIAVGITLLCAFIAWACSGKKSDEPLEPEPEVETEFQRCKREAARVRIDSETGEPYAYKLVRVPADPPRSSKEPTIAEPMQRKVRA